MKPVRLPLDKFLGECEWPGLGSLRRKMVQNSGRESLSVYYQED